MNYIGIDPGPVQSALVELDGFGRVPFSQTMTNEAVLGELGTRVGFSDTTLVIEMFTYYANMHAGAQVFESCVWIGRWIEAWGGPYTLVKRPVVCRHLCGRPYAKKSETRAALLEMFPASGGGARPVIGTTKQPGPLHGITGHAWDALAVAVTARDMDDPNYGRKMKK